MAIPGKSPVPRKGPRSTPPGPVGACISENARARFYLVHFLVQHSLDLRKAWPLRDAFRPEFLAAPGADDQIGFSRHYLPNRHHAVLSCASIPSIGEDVDAAGDLDELGDPADPGDERIVPLLEEYPWPSW
jgi:hypothetical protein